MSAARKLTALLARRAGVGHVVSIEADEDLAEYARRRLQTAGTDVTVETADGAAGWHAGAPFDRVIATYAVDEVPWTWGGTDTPRPRLPGGERRRRSQARTTRHARPHPAVCAVRCPARGADHHSRGRGRRQRLAARLHDGEASWAIARQHGGPVGAGTVAK